MSDNNHHTLTYTYDADGNRATAALAGFTTFGYTYTGRDELKTVTAGALSGGTVSGGTLSTLNFDASGNRTSVVNGGTTTTYAAANSLNQYPTIGGAGATYGANGNLATYNGWTYTYDSMNRLTIATNGTTSANFFYDGLNRQVLRSITAVGNKFTVWDGWNAFAEYGAGNAPTGHWLYGAGGDLVADSLIGQYYYADGLGSTSHVANLSGALLESYTYDLAGTPTFYNPSGTVLPNGSAYGINHLFTGQQWHASLGFYDLRNRFLLPSLGRFLQPDPISFSGDPANLYRYCANNPVNGRDRFGLQAVVEPHLPDEDPSTQEIFTGKKDVDVFVSNQDWLLDKILEALNQPQTPTGPYYVPPPGSDAKVPPGQPIPTAVPPPVWPSHTPPASPPPMQGPPAPPTPTPKPFILDPYDGPAFREGHEPGSPKGASFAGVGNVPNYTVWGGEPWGTGVPRGLVILPSTGEKVIGW